jgi:voltage-gated potassium channel
LGLIFAEPLNYWEALYLTIQTVTTVGFGDIVVRTDWGRFILFILMVSGVSLMLYSMDLVMAFLVEGQLANVYGRRKMKKRLQNIGFKRNKRKNRGYSYCYCT